jgi:hypothetical protein
MILTRILAAGLAVGVGVGGSVLWQVIGSRQVAWARPARSSGIVAAAVVAGSAGMPARVAQANGPKEKSNIVAALDYLDHLRSCTPYTFKYPVPLARSIAENIILGKNGDACKVNFDVPNCCMAVCEFSPAAINALTAKAKYRKARAGRLSGSLSEAEDQKFGRQCKWVYFPGQVSIPPQK